MQSHENPQKTTSAAGASAATTAADELTVYVPARWGDMDAYGHVNNVAMLSIMEEARVALFGPPPSSGQKPTVAPNPPIPLFDLVPEGVQASSPSTASATSRSCPTPVSPCPYVHAWKR